MKPYLLGSAQGQYTGVRHLALAAQAMIYMVMMMILMMVVRLTMTTAAVVAAMTRRLPTTVTMADLAHSTSIGTLADLG